MSQFLNINVSYVYVRDFQAAKKFYQDTLGWSVAWSDDQVGWEEYGPEGATHFAINVWDRDEPMPLSGATIVFLSKMPIKPLRICGRAASGDDVVNIQNSSPTARI
jgi:catechol 2,3-dioxygenase-like lactoylglutathione lyase family enzyme